MKIVILLLLLGTGAHAEDAKTTLALSDLVPTGQSMYRTANASVPVLGHGRGVCHVYLDKDADVEKGVNIAYNAKVQRPGVCNAMESLLIHEHMMWDILPKITGEYKKAGVEIRGDERTRGLISQAKAATEEDWETEYHDKIVSIKIVDSLDEAIEHINRYGSGHTDSIVTNDSEAADKFLKSVDASCVMVNASTRLHDGSVFGFGSEIGISTQKLHARGTMGLRELTSAKYLVEGTGQIRE
jgi:glutamate-5-semialdehyde dehydrogenase